MRCQCCNDELTDYDATVKHKETGQYLDMCTPCRNTVLRMAHFEVFDRPELLREYDIDLEDCRDSDADTQDLGYNHYRDTPEQ